MAGAKAAGGTEVPTGGTEVPSEALTVDAMAVKVAAARVASSVLEAALRWGSWTRGTAAGPA